MRAAAGWFFLMLGAAIGGSWATAVAAAASSFYDPIYKVAYGYSLPVHLVQGAYPGWPILLAMWTMLAVIGFSGWKLAAELGKLNAAVAVALGCYGAVAIALSFSPIIPSVDVYYYVAFGRIYGVHGLNPYFLHTAVEVGGDTTLGQAFGYLGNPLYNDPYGPLWTLMAGLIAKASVGLSLYWQVWSYRAVAVLAALATLAGIRHGLRDAPAAERTRRTALVAFHPLFLYETAVGAHNEILMVAPAVWAFALVDDLPLIAALLMGTSIAFKYMSVVALPFLVWRAFAKSRVAGAIALAVALGIPVLCFKPFWIGEGALHGVIGHINALGMSPTWLAAAPLYAAGMGGTMWPRIVQLAFITAFLGIAIVSFFGFIRSERYADVWRTVTAFLWASPIIQPWYLLMLSPAIAGNGRWALYAWWFCALIPLRYALECVGGTPFAVLAGLTLVILALPVVFALRLPIWDEPAPAGR